MNYKKILLLSLLSLPVACQAMVFNKLYPCSDQSCLPYILATGPITPGTTNQFIQFYNQNPAAFIYFNSDGGDIQEGIQFGKVINRAKINTYVSSQPYKYAYPNGNDIIYSTTEKSPTCTTACLLAFMGGNKHIIDSNSFLGTYNINLLKNTAKNLNTQIRNYTDSVGYIRDMSNLFYKNNNRKQPIYWLNSTDIYNYSLNNNDQIESGWNLKNSADVSYSYSYNEISIFNTGQKVGISMFYNNHRPYLTFKYILSSTKEIDKFNSYLNNKFTFNIIMDQKEYSTDNIQWIKNDDNSFRFTIELDPDFIQKLKNETGNISFNFDYPTNIDLNYFKPNVTVSSNLLYSTFNQTQTN